MGKTQVRIPQDLIELAPAYLENRIRDLGPLKDALAREDFDFIAKLSHKTKGTAGGYGFDELGALAKSLENAAKSRNFSDVESTLERMRGYLENIEITS